MREEVHGSAVMVNDRALLITGRAGAGKTTLALELVALGAELIADDRVRTEADGVGRVWLSAPDGLAGLAEVRGFGLMRLACRSRAALALVADLDATEPERLPPRRERIVAGIACPLILCEGRPGLAAVLTCLLRAEEWPGPEFLPGRR